MIITAVTIMMIYQEQSVISTVVVMKVNLKIVDHSDCALMIIIKRGVMMKLSLAVVSSVS